MRNAFVLFLTSCGLALMVTACSLSVGGSRPRVEIGEESASKRALQRLNFSESQPIYNVYKIELGFDFTDKTQLKMLSLSTIPVHRLSLLAQSDTPDKKASAAVLVASKAALDPNQLLELALRAFVTSQSGSAEIITYDGRSNALRVCDGSVDGYELEPKPEKPTEILSFRVNILGNTRDTCLLLGKIVVPKSGNFALDINGRNIIPLGASPEDHKLRIESWNRALHEKSGQNDLVQSLSGIRQIVDRL